MKWILLTPRLKTQRFQEPVMGERNILKADESQQWAGKISGWIESIQKRRLERGGGPRIWKRHFPGYICRPQ